ncbi:MAG: C39 family peptidase [Chloroflexota bacterium]|jgi:hypothetical protein
MGSLKPGEKAKRDTQRLSSTVPNDYNHLNVPGSLNFPLDHPRSRRPHARRRRGGLPAWMKALLAMAGVMFALGVVALVIFAIAFPPFFRGLEPRYQQRLIDMFPPFESLRATVPFEVLPTLSGASDSEAAQQLLLTQEGPGVAGTPQPGGLGLTDPGSDALPETPPATSPGYIPSPTPTESAGGIPVGALPTQEPTPLPVYEAPQVAALPTFTPQVLPTEVPLPATVKLGNIRYEEQGWNNCGPTTMTMALSYYGWTDNQTTAANWMKPHPEDKNVSPWQMVRFVNERTGVKALYRYGGTLTVLKRLLAAGFPVVVEESIQPAGEGWLGHYVLFIGYDDYQQHFLTFDSYLGSNKGQGRPSPYSVFDEKWRHFNRVFMVVYEPTREMELRRALGDYVDPAHGYRTALAQARDEATKNRDDKWAWFNMGTSYTLLGEYENAAFAYDEALRQGLPPRMLWYQFGLYEAYYYTGRYNDVLAHAQNTARYTPYVEESYYWEGMVYAAQGNQQAALEKFDQVLRFNRNFFPALEAKSQVEAGTFTVASLSH